ncbi:MAG: TonB-dependent receptor [Cytophagia bacterium]|nr:MAG: TonB-dependent receptor [Cytophagia bacterium]
MAQTGTIRGTLKDSKNNEDLIGATVLIDGTTTGAATDINGFFSISKVPVGKVKLVLNYVGYRKKEIADVTVEADKITEINALMDDEARLLQEVKVVGARQTNTEVSVLSEIKASQNIVSGISSQQIARTLDRDAAQVVKRVPGITIVGDRFINIRGLNSRYNNVMLHNAFTPSMETDVKAFSFDVIPSGQIDRLLIYKTPSADLPGEFAGGIVKVFTKNIPDQNSITLDYSLGIRQGTTFQEFNESKQGPGYWTSFNNGFLDLPANFPSDIRAIQNNPALIELAGRSLRNEWVPVKSNSIPDQRVALTGNFKMSLGKIRIGNVTAINFSESRLFNAVERNDYNIGAGNEIETLFLYDDKYNTRNNRLGVLHNWSFRINENHSIDFKNLFNQISTGRYINRTGQDIAQNFRPNSASFDQVYRGIYTSQLGGKHKLNGDKSVVDWVAGYNYSYRDQPDYKRYRADVLDPVTGRSEIYIPIGQAQSFFLGRFSSAMVENGYTASVNLTQKVGKKDKEIELKFGGFYEFKDRSFKARNLGYVRSNNFSPNLLTADINTLFQNIRNDGGIQLGEQTNPNDSYTASNDQIAGYGSANIPLTSKFNAIVGTRVEYNRQKMNSTFLGGAPARVDNPITSVLPSANLTYNFSEKMLLRAAYGMTVNRPEFRELAPFSFFDFDFNVVYEGNPALNIAKVHNMDLRWELYPTPNELVSVAAFYKFFDSPIESTIDLGSTGVGSKTFVANNAKSAYSTGIELEVKKGLASFGAAKFLQNTSLLFNTALIYSRVDLGDKSFGQSNNRPLQGQSPYIVNVGINYSEPKKDLQINLLYNVIGQRIIAVGFEAYPDLYEMPRNVVDLTFSKGIKDRWTIKGGIQDILNQPFQILQDANGDKKFDRETDLTVQKYRLGQLFSLGFAYRIL